ncbi:MAG: DNA primase, partial [Pseudobutyrivibrio sp.]|nr:DNA primase [Pseudobutyrivibrio sp.]
IAVIAHVDAGKSTLVETIAYMLGNENGYAKHINPESLAMKQNKDSRQASGDIARLNGCRFLNASEPPKRMLFDSALVKNFVGNDTITARFLHESEFEFKPTFKLFMNTNYLPLITDDTMFSGSKVHVISFDRHFDEQEQDKELKNRLREADNMSGILNWCIDGLKAFYEHGAIPPSSVIEATNQYRNHSDKIGNFFDEVMEKSEENCKAGDVYNYYRDWCDDNGLRAESKQSFFEELRSRNLFAERGSVRVHGMKTTWNKVVIGYVIKDADDDQEIPFK